ncbi:MAG: GNAT family N-acetyltransferase [Bacteroidetes bacterium]|nr:GNAT family N-acetyltransferase [Bacteroidota bacterium]
MAPIHLFDDYYYREASPEEFGAFYTAHHRRMFEHLTGIPIEPYMSGAELQRRKQYDDMVTAMYELRLFILCRDEVIGWHIGRQAQRDAANMSNTALFAAHRGRGVYTAIIRAALEHYRAQGFGRVVSKHHASNNAVLIPKLRAGFQITGFEIDERYGLFVNLTYYFNEQRKNVYRFRTGALRPDEEIRKYL